MMSLWWRPGLLRPGGVVVAAGGVLRQRWRLWAEAAAQRLGVVVVLLRLCVAADRFGLRWAEAGVEALLPGAQTMAL